jgi:hypothetical protein
MIGLGSEDAVGADVVSPAQDVTNRQTNNVVNVTRFMIRLQGRCIRAQA